MAKVIALCMQKGGVGKTTTSQVLAVELARKGYKVLAIDGDPQGNLSHVLGHPNTDTSNEVSLAEIFIAEKDDLDYDIEEAILPANEGVDVIISNLTLATAERSIRDAIEPAHLLENAIGKIKGDYDFIVIDSLPSLNDITINILTAADEVIIPIKPSVHSVVGMAALKDTINRIRRSANPRLKINGILFTLVDARTNIAKGIIADVHEQFGENVRIYNSIIPQSQKAAEEAAYEMKSVSTYIPNHNLAVAYRNFVDEFLESQGLSDVKE